MLSSILKKVTIIIIVLITSITISFMLSTNNKGNQIIDHKIESLVDEWKLSMDSSRINYHNGFNRIKRIQIGTIENRYVGLSNKGTQSIFISDSQAKAGAYSLRGTLYHELGHYVFNLSHNSCGIMRDVVYNKTEYKTNWLKLKKEYLKCCKENEFESKY